MSCHNCTRLRVENDSLTRENAYLRDDLVAARIALENEDLNLVVHLTTCTRCGHPSANHLTGACDVLNCACGDLVAEVTA